MAITKLGKTEITQTYRPLSKAEKKKKKRKISEDYPDSLLFQMMLKSELRTGVKTKDVVNRMYDKYEMDKKTMPVVTATHPHTDMNAFFAEKAMAEKLSKGLLKPTHPLKRIINKATLKDTPQDKIQEVDFGTSIHDALEGGAEGIIGINPKLYKEAPSIVGHELGHAVNHRNTLISKILSYSRPVSALSLAAIPAMHFKMRLPIPGMTKALPRIPGKYHNALRILAALSTGLMLGDEGAASLRSRKAIKELGGKGSMALPLAFGTYSVAPLAAVGMDRYGRQLNEDRDRIAGLVKMMQKTKSMQKEGARQSTTERSDSGKSRLINSFAQNKMNQDLANLSRLELLQGQMAQLEQASDKDVIGDFKEYVSDRSKKPAKLYAKNLARHVPAAGLMGYGLGSIFIRSRLLSPERRLLYTALLPALLGGLYSTSVTKDELQVDKRLQRGRSPVYEADVANKLTNLSKTWNKAIAVS